MQKRKTVTAIALALGLTYMPPVLYADHHEGSGMEGSGMGHAAHGTKEAAKEAVKDMKDAATAGTEAKAEEAADTMKDAMPEGSAAGMPEKTSEKVSEGSH